MIKKCIFAKIGKIGGKLRTENGELRTQSASYQAP